ncbi:MAG: putative ABC transporter permease subunit [Christensenellales bacterium]|jgi:ABC-2 type transport system permease protein
MIKPLLKKELAEYWAAFRLRSRKWGTIFTVLLLLLLYASLVAAFCGISALFSSALLPLGLGWIYFAIMGFAALLLTVLGSTFGAYASLYCAKDNEMLLAMPIPPRTILLSRMVSIFLVSLSCALCGWGPACVFYAVKSGVSAPDVTRWLILFFSMALIGVAISCAAGFVVALIASRLRNKSLLSATLGFLVFGIYYYLNFRLEAALENMAQNVDALVRFFSVWARPFSALGAAAAGDMGQTLLFASVCVALFFLAWSVLSKTFLSLTTVRRGAKRKRGGAIRLHVSDVPRALFQKEMRRFLSSPSYIMNSGMGLFMMLMASVAAVLNAKLLALLPEKPLILTGAACVLIATATISAPSISLEAKTLWILKSLPVPAWEVLDAKRKLHAALVLPCTCIFVLSAGIAAKVSAGTIFLSLLCALAFALLTGSMGLLLNLRFPYFTWTNETAAVKNSTSVALAMFGGVLLLAPLGALWYFTQMQTPIVLGLAVALFAGLFAGCHALLKTRGVRMFENL